MTESLETINWKKTTIKDLVANPLGQKQALFLSTYTGLEPPQVAMLHEQQKTKIFLGLVKQLELATCLHQPKVLLRPILIDYFQSPDISINSLAHKVNSLLVFGDIRDLAETGVEDLHSQLSHFWRILGWEELATMDQFQSKHPPGSIEDIETSCGNLIRTLQLLKEQWVEKSIGPKLIVPTAQVKTYIEKSPGYAAIKQQSHPHALAVVTSRNEGIPSIDAQEDFYQKALLLEKLLAQFPAEFAMLIFDYYLFTKGLDKTAYNVALAQAYSVNGAQKVKGLLNGKFVVIAGKRDGNGYSHSSILAASDSNIPLGSQYTTGIVPFDENVSSDDFIIIVHGNVAHAINHFPHLLNLMDGKSKEEVRKSLQAFAKAIGASGDNKPIIPFVVGNASEISSVTTTEDMMSQTLGQIISWVRKKRVKLVSLEAGHLHADRTPTSLQKTGIQIGAYLSTGLKQVGLQVVEQPMIDEDHVINALDHFSYVNLMKSLGFYPQEVIYESSPVVREIAVAAIGTLLQAYPNNVYMEGNALLFSIPDSDLRVELIKDVNISPFELGCVIFDAGLSLYRVFPDLAQLYSSDTGQVVHEGMFKVYQKHQNPSERLQIIKSAFPLKTMTWQEIESTPALPQLPKTESTICNVLENFYAPQQIKLVGVLKALGISLPVIGVSITDQGLQVNIVE